ncbi:unnamed protein product [Gongylonema pulchrum]|uniref:Fibronectin type-III domain-containing protein n=1 Tax=Gongylonema pulchrum TaxID=637853 RepID=A0A3P6QXS6_9BILA|nr:unnamed protein product [Gongylonema pulchrum]
MWMEPKFPNGAITGYKLYLTSDPNQPIDQWQVYDIGPDDEPKLIIERGRLLPETPYYIKIVATGPAGIGVPSDIVAFETVSGAPVDAPTDVLPTVEEDNTMDISWTGPSVPNGPIVVSISKMLQKIPS